MKTKDLTKMSLFLGILIISGFFSIPVPFVGLPIVLQNMVAMLSGAILGKKRGAAVVLTFLFLVGLGFPFLPGGRGGAAIFFSPSGGFLLGYVCSAYIIGFFLEKISLDKKLYIFLIFFFCGTILINFFGVFSLSHYGKASFLAAIKMVMVFIPLDTVKAFINTLIFYKLKRIRIES